MRAGAAAILILVLPTASACTAAPGPLQDLVVSDGAQELLRIDAARPPSFCERQGWIVPFDGQLVAWQRRLYNLQTGAAHDFGSRDAPVALAAGHASLIDWEGLLQVLEVATGMRRVVEPPNGTTWSRTMGGFAWAENGTLAARPFWTYNVAAAGWMDQNRTLANTPIPSGSKLDGVSASWFVFRSQEERWSHPRFWAHDRNSSVTRGPFEVSLSDRQRDYTEWHVIAITEGTATLVHESGPSVSGSTAAAAELDLVTGTQRSATVYPPQTRMDRKLEFVAQDRGAWTHPSPYETTPPVRPYSTSMTSPSSWTQSTTSPTTATRTALTPTEIPMIGWVFLATAITAILAIRPRPRA